VAIVERTTSAGYLPAVLLVCFSPQIRLAREEVVQDAASNKRVANATVLLTMHGQEFRSLMPHGKTATSVCLGSTVVKSDSEGKFAAWHFGLRSPLTNRRFAIQAFKPPWYQLGTQWIAIQTRPIDRQTGVLVKLKKDDEARWTFASGSVGVLRGGEPIEDTMSKALTAIASVGSTLAGCHGDGEQAVAEALTYAIENARTEAEVEFISLRCQEAADRSRAEPSLKNRSEARTVSTGCTEFLEAQLSTKE
jgi:hypothetical protein